jgi:pyridoxal/pyridoxine/pyridoxamine kinase
MIAATPTRFEYGTAEFYEESFSDILADVDSDNPEYADAIVEGFLKSIDSWFNYHDHQATAYDELRQRVRKALTV